ncbi:MAG: type II secretion system protein [Candidatus Hydrogenedentes bacterium]|nr:type II secretion system protein [Candidatus Hydrogenedentota bacterium]
MKRRGFTVPELVVVLAILAVLGIILLPALSRGREAARRAACVNNLKQFSTAFKMYATEWKRYLPPCAPYANSNGALLFSAPAAAMVPQYLSDLSIARCPSDTGYNGAGELVRGRLPNQGDFSAWILEARDENRPDSMDYYRSAELGRSYCYKGYTVTTVQEYYGMWGVMTALPPDGTLSVLYVNDPVLIKNFNNDLVIADLMGTWPAWVPKPPTAMGTGGGGTVMRLREGVERLLTTSAGFKPSAGNPQALVPVMWDAYGDPSSLTLAASGVSFNHIPGGSNVLYLDGHVEWVAYPDRFPMSNDKRVLADNSFYGLR